MNHETLFAKDLVLKEILEDYKLAEEAVKDTSHARHGEVYDKLIKVILESDNPFKTAKSVSNYDGYDFKMSKLVKSLSGDTQNKKLEKKLKKEYGNRLLAIEEVTNSSSIWIYILPTKSEWHHHLYEHFEKKRQTAKGRITQRKNRILKFGEKVIQTKEAAPRKTVPIQLPSHEEILNQDPIYLELLNKISLQKNFINSWNDTPSKEETEKYHASVEQIASLKDFSTQNLLENIASNFGKEFLIFKAITATGKSLHSVEEDCLSKHQNKNLLTLSVYPQLKKRHYVIRKSLIASLKEWHLAKKAQNHKTLISLQDALKRRKKALLPDLFPLQKKTFKKNIFVPKPVEVKPVLPVKVPIPVTVTVLPRNPSLKVPKQLTVKEKAQRHQKLLLFLCDEFIPKFTPDDDEVDT